MNEKANPNHDPPRRWSRIEVAMLEAQGELQHQGSIVPRPLRSGHLMHVIRYRRTGENGRKVQSAIYLGDDPIDIERARELLAQWQTVHNPSRSPDSNIRKVWETIKTASGQFRLADRAAFLKHFRTAGTDPRKLLTASVTWPGLLQQRRLRRRLRRPRKARMDGMNTMTPRVETP